jgi:RNA polymerase sigma-70 factor (ECF subfamily)
MERHGGGHSSISMPHASLKPAMPNVAEAQAPPAELHQLFESHLAFVWRNLRRLGVPDSQVEDAAQDVFLVVHRRLDTWRAELSTVETWLFGIVLRVARNYRRAQQRRLAWLLPAPDRKTLHEAPSMAAGPVELLAQREAAQLFERAVGALDEAKRAVFLLVDVEQLAVPQAALALGINPNTAYWRLGKARLAFRRALLRLSEDAIDRDRRMRR